MTPHVLRHTFAKNFLDAGENLVTVATPMAHTRLDTTAVNIRPNTQDLEKVVERLAGTE
ncbi:MAG: tyrosine-type recombinase/integrase [Anaerolineae bacterium]|nr:tyrosine-type recombinase/integrase [Anaerolineae bacterium]